jgi:hypothetical protein
LAQVPISNHVFHETNELKNMIPQGNYAQFPQGNMVAWCKWTQVPKETYVSQNNIPTFLKNPCFPMANGPKFTCCLGQMGPNSPKQPDVPLVPKAIHVLWGTLGPFASSLGKTLSFNSLLPRAFASTYFASQGNLAKEVRSSCISQHQPLL